MDKINKTQIPKSPVSQKVYEIVKGKSQTWAIGVDEYSHEIYSLHGDPSGMGGSEVLFKQKDGSEYKAKGVWHSNPDALYKDTCIDLRQRTISYGFISLERKNIGMLLDSYENLVFCDKEWKVGLYKRIEYKACELSNKLNKKLYYYSQTLGGSTAYFKEPNIKEYIDIVIDNLIYKTKLILNRRKEDSLILLNQKVYLQMKFSGEENGINISFSLKTRMKVLNKEENISLDINFDLNKDVNNLLLLVKDYLNKNLDQYVDLLDKEEKAILLNELL